MVKFGIMIQNAKLMLNMQKNNDEVFHYFIIKNEKEFWTLITCYSKNDTKAKNCVDQIYKNVKIKDKK